MWVFKFKSGSFDAIIEDFVALGRLASVRVAVTEANDDGRYNRARKVFCSVSVCSRLVYFLSVVFYTENASVHDVTYNISDYFTVV